LTVESEMYASVTRFIDQRFPVGWGGAAIIRTADDRHLTSVALVSANGSAGLCMETGAMCEAQKLNANVTHSLCVARDDEHSPFKVLSPCGICQERLLYWGEEVLVGITTADGALLFKRLGEINPDSWTRAYRYSELEHFGEGHS